jgi:hypothetical protein
MNENVEGWGHLEDAGREEQLEAMEEWFRERYEDPAEQTPYESKEGGYIWIWGGPYDAEEVLREKFEGVVPDDVIEELATDLTGENPGWAPIPDPADYDQGLFEAVSSNAAARQTLDDALETIQALLRAEVEAAVIEPYRRLLYANVIAAMETYLSDTFINRVLDDAELLQKYLDHEPKFNQQKVPYKDIVREAGRVKAAARNELLDVVWHNIGKVKALYAHVLEVDLGDTNTIGSAIQVRHDIVHRNGRKKDGSLVSVSPADLSVLISAIIGLASRIELKLDFGLEDDHFDGTDF